MCIRDLGVLQYLKALTLYCLEITEDLQAYVSPLPPYI
jgi:hypothetical protein